MVFLFARHFAIVLLATTISAAPIERTRAASNVPTLADPMRGLVAAEPLYKRDARFTKVISTDFADPSLFQDSDQWWAFASNNHKNVAVQGGRLINIQIARSPDFEKWSLLHNQDALPVLPPWVDKSQPSVWSPKVIRNDAGKYVLYFSAMVAGRQGKHCIGSAVASNLAGPYAPLPTPFVCPVGQGGAIDASGFRDTDGSLYVVYKVDGNRMGHGGRCGNSVGSIVPTPLMLQRVAPDGTTPTGQPIRILDRDATDGPLIEAPSLVSVPASQGGGYALFYSSNCYRSDLYDVAYAFSESIAGPYVKHGVVANTDTANLYSPGGADVARDGVHMVLHAGNAAPVDGWRAMYTAQLDIDSRRQVVTVS